MTDKRPDSEREADSSSPRRPSSSKQPASRVPAFRTHVTEAEPTGESIAASPPPDPQVGLYEQHVQRQQRALKKISQQHEQQFGETFSGLRHERPHINAPQHPQGGKSFDVALFAGLFATWFHSKWKSQDQTRDEAARKESSSAESAATQDRSSQQKEHAQLAGERQAEQVPTAPDRAPPAQEGRLPEHEHLRPEDTSRTEQHTVGGQRSVEADQQPSASARRTASSETGNSASKGRNSVPHKEPDRGCEM